MNNNEFIDYIHFIIYNVTESGEIVVYQHNGNTPKNGYHCYKATDKRDVPNEVLRQMYKDGVIPFAQYKKLMH